MKYRIVEVSPPGVGDVYYEVEATEPMYNYYGRSLPSGSLDWRFLVKFNTVEACKRYIQNQAQTTRKVISEIEV